MCLKPKWIYKKGNYKENNYRGSQGSPYEIGTFSKCGVCEQCLAEKANNWVVRNYYESQNYKEIAFLTLTYKDSPIIIVRKDIQDFFKRFRYEINKEYYNKLNNVKKGLRGEQLKLWKLEHQNEYTKIRYFYIGEYGKKGRPHFHAIIYGWTDKKPNYLDISKRGNIVYQSEDVQKAWGLGRTSYQKFSLAEIPYTTLYTTPAEIFSKAYKMTAEKLKTLEFYARNKKMDKSSKNNLLSEIKALHEELEKNKAEYVLVKEINGWSIALGWEKFAEQYFNSEKYVFTEYVEQCEYVTPTPWVKKLANQYGEIQAIEEMFRREEMLSNVTDEIEEKMRNESKLFMRRKKELMEWHEQKDEFYEL